MHSADGLNSVLKDLMGRLGNQESNGNSSKNAGKSNCSGNANDKGTSFLSLTPSKALVIAGLLSDVLDVDSILVDKDQEVQIVLAGSLKQKTQLEKVMDQIGTMPFDEVVKAIVGRL